MLLLAFPLYLVHEIEEYILPGGFVEFFNKNLLKVNADDKIVPVDREVSLWINLFLYGFVFNLLLPKTVILPRYYKRVKEQ